MFYMCTFYLLPVGKAYWFTEDIWKRMSTPNGDKPVNYSKRKASKDVDEPLLKQPKLTTATSTPTQTMLDQYVLVRFYLQYLQVP